MVWPTIVSGFQQLLAASRHVISQACRRRAILFLFIDNNIDQNKTQSQSMADLRTFPALSHFRGYLQALLTGPNLRNAVLVLAAGVLAGLARNNYLGYLALGKGGLPHNVFGWLMQAAGQLVAKWDTRSLTPFSNPRHRETLGEAGATTFLGGVVIPERKGGQRPTVPGYVAPQRQMDQLPESEGMRDRMEDFLAALVGKNPGVLALKPSALEGVGMPALWLDTHSASSSSSSSSSPSLPAFMKGIKGETVHVHPECSSHVTLSMADAEEIVRKGWAERHKLSGVGSFLPWTYLLVYAPRNEDELNVWKGIVTAGVRFVCAAAGRELAFDGDGK